MGKFKNTLLAVVAMFSAHAALAAPVCSVGESGYALWKGQWYKVEVQKVNEYQTQCFVTYKGYDHSWDEWVGKSRYSKHKPSTSATPAYHEGSRVIVEWKGKWYPARVLEVGSDSYLIHYEGYESSWDEWVGLSRMKPN